MDSSCGRLFTAANGSTNTRAKMFMESLEPGVQNLQVVRRCSGRKMPLARHKLLSAVFANAVGVLVGVPVKLLAGPPEFPLPDPARDFPSRPRPPGGLLDRPAFAASRR